MNRPGLKELMHRFRNWSAPEVSGTLIRRKERAMTDSTLSLIDRNVAIGRQDVTYTEVLRCGTHKLRVSINSNAYDFQSWARIDAFDPKALQWNLLASIPYALMKTPHGLYVRRGAGAGEFMEDRDQLVNLAVEILS